MATDEVEVWLEVPGYNGDYLASSFGRIKTMRIGRRRNYCEKILAAWKNNAGYLTVRVSRGGKTSTKFVHRLIATAFHGSPDSTLEVDHLDGDKENNRPDNLQWTTHSKNLKRAVERLGQWQHIRSGENHHKAKLTERRVEEIRQLHKVGTVTQRQLAKNFGVSPVTISHIVNMKTWNSAPTTTAG